jgi:hypothetical protein
VDSLLLTDFFPCCIDTEHAHKTTVFLSRALQVFWSAASQSTILSGVLYPRCRYRITGSSTDSPLCSLSPGPTPPISHLNLIYAWFSVSSNIRSMNSGPSEVLRCYLNSRKYIRDGHDGSFSTHSSSQRGLGNLDHVFCKPSFSSLTCR